MDSAAKRADFLDHLAATSNVSAAARAAGISKVQVYRIRRMDPGFRADWNRALREGYEALEIVLLERARHGVREPVFHQGRKVGTRRAYDDAAALKLLAAHRATVAAERALESLGGEGGGAADPGREALATIEEIKARLVEMRERRAALEADRAGEGGDG